MVQGNLYIDEGGNGSAGNRQDVWKWASLRAVGKMRGHTCVSNGDYQHMHSLMVGFNKNYRADNSMRPAG